jgi:hypothetical protein
MKLFDIDGNLVNVDVRASNYPVKAKSRSSLQGQTGEKVEELYPYDPVLEDFTIPGSRMSLDFFLPQKKLAIEVDGRQHHEFIPHFHGDRATSTAFAKQKVRDSKKEQWCESNGIKLIRIVDKDDLEKLDG